MLNTNATNFRKDVYNLLEQTIKYNEPINISTKSGNVILLSESDYNSLTETVYLSSVPKLKDKITEGMKTAVEDCLTEDEVNW